MGIPNVLLCYVHRPMCVGLFMRYGFRQAGCRVRTMGPLEPRVYDHAFPDDDWEYPDFPIEQHSPMDATIAVECAAAAGFRADLLVMCDQYDPYFLCGESPIPWAYIAVENFNAEQRQRWEQRRGALEFHMIYHGKGNAAELPPGSEWLPFAFDPYIHPFLNLKRDKKVVQIGTHYEPRPTVWNGIRAAFDSATSLSASAYGNATQESPSTIFGKVFSYAGLAETYNRGMVTLSASNCDFLPMRVFEAMAMGAVLLSDDVPAVRNACGSPWVSPEEPGLWFAHDGTVDGQIRRAQEVAAMPWEVLAGVSAQAFLHAYARHTYCHRARRILECAGLRGATRMVN